MKPFPIKKRIFVTGTPRSGTTFVGRVLSLPINVDYIHEPFNVDGGMYEMTQKFLYMRKGMPHETDFHSLVSRLMKYKVKLKRTDTKNKRVIEKLLLYFTKSQAYIFLQQARLNVFHDTILIKDPLGCLLVEYLTREFGFVPLILIRHPILYIKSTIRLNWYEKYRAISLEPINAQQELVEDFLDDEKEFVFKIWNTEIEYCAALWRCLNKILLKMANTNPETLLIKHEEVCRDPLSVFRRLYQHFGLKMSTRIQRIIAKITGPQNLKFNNKADRSYMIRRSSKHLIESCNHVFTKDVRKQIYDITKDIAEPLYSKETFKID